MNAIAPPPKRRHGTGTIGQTYNGKWRYRLPGGRVERGGFDTREEARAALDAALKGRDWKLIELHRTVKNAVRLAGELGVSVEDLARAARTELLIEDAKARRAARREHEEKETEP